ncbi:hypothetical protein niasHT_024782 [Heterodera trifolii]|uniref:Uncharacterized protein n=1 Tax=Heterodera trifolii TaxID=157864 RepID=A0ABD2JH50_9BILA
MVPSAHQGRERQSSGISIPFRLRRGWGTLFAPRGACPQIFKFFPLIILICQRGTAARHGSGRSQQRRHPQVRFSSFATLVRFQFFNSLAELSQWRKEFLDGRYGSKQPTPPFTPRASSPSFPIPVIVGRQMFPGDDGYESEDDEILLPPPPVPPQIDHPPPNVPAVRVQPMHVGQHHLPLRALPQFDYHPQNVPAVRVQQMQQWHEPLPLRDMPQFDHLPPNVPEIGVGLIHDGQQPMPLRVLPQIAHRQLNFPAVRVQPMQQGHEPLPLRDMQQFDHPPPYVPAIRVQPVQQPIPLRDVPLFVNPPPNVPEIRVGPIHDVQQPMPLRDMPQIHHPLRNVTSIWTKLWLLFLSLWVFLQAIHVRQIQRDYAIPQFAHPPPNVPLIFDHPPAIQPRQQPLPLRDVLQFDHPLPHGPPNHPNPSRVLEVIRRLREWRGRPQDPRRPTQWMN